MTTEIALYFQDKPIKHDPKKILGMLPLAQAHCKQSGDLDFALLGIQRGENETPLKSINTITWTILKNCLLGVYPRPHPTSTRRCRKPIYQI
jgi:hypothetical protein